jgi:hypothetical protein
MQTICLARKQAMGVFLGVWVGHFKVGLFVGCFLMWGCKSSLLHGHDLCGQGSIPLGKLSF